MINVDIELMIESFRIMETVFGIVRYAFHFILILRRCCEVLVSRRLLPRSELVVADMARDQLLSVLLAVLAISGASGTGVSVESREGVLK